jgi:hypothetical protein
VDYWLTLSNLRGGTYIIAGASAGMTDERPRQELNRPCYFQAR